MPSGQGGKSCRSPQTAGSRKYLNIAGNQADISRQTAGTNPIHNKKPKKKAQELDEDDLAHKAKLAAGS
jgi:hypothetical protein